MTSADVAVVPTLWPTIIAHACSNEIAPVLRTTRVVAAAAVELCITIVISTPTPARIQSEAGPVNPSKDQETPSIPVCMKSIAMKSRPKPASTAPADRSLPRATIQRRAPMPTMGRARSAIRRRKPKIARSHGVDVVPRVAPIITPIDSVNVIRPALTKPMTVRIAAVEDWMTAVNAAPDAMARSFPEARRCSQRRSESPARPRSPSVR